MQTSQNEKGRTMKLKPMEDSSDEEEGKPFSMLAHST